MDERERRTDSVATAAANALAPYLVQAHRATGTNLDALVSAASDDDELMHLAVLYAHLPALVEHATEEAIGAADDRLRLAMRQVQTEAHGMLAATAADITARVEAIGRECAAPRTQRPPAHRVPRYPRDAGT